MEFKEMFWEGEIELDFGDLHHIPCYMECEYQTDGTTYRRGELRVYMDFGPYSGMERVNITHAVREYVKDDLFEEYIPRVMD